MKNYKKLTPHKNQGITLISVVLISVLIITAVMGVANVLVKELAFSADTLNGERAYFAAESGVEMANLTLKENPIYHGTKKINLTRAEGNTKINNLATEFFVILKPKQQQTVRLQTSINGKTQKIKTLPTLSINISQKEVKKNVFWTIRCNESGENSSTASIQGNFNQIGNDLINWIGKIDKSDDKTRFETFDTKTKPKNVGTYFWNASKSFIAKDTCTLSLENLSKNKVKITITNNETMAPLTGTVTATGTANNRKKVIQYKTDQNNVDQWINWGAIGTTK